MIFTKIIKYLILLEVFQKLHFINYLAVFLTVIIYKYVEVNKVQAVFEKYFKKVVFTK